MRAIRTLGQYASRWILWRATLRFFMRAVRRLGQCNRSRAAWYGGLSLLLVGYMLHSTGELVSQGWAQERGKLTSRANSGSGGVASIPAVAPDFGKSATGDERADQMLREGARVVNQAVTCRGVGDRLLVELPHSSTPLVVLENLAAQRILKAIQDDIGGEQWIINGSITEFQGRNYILLDRVMRQSRQ